MKKKNRSKIINEIGSKFVKSYKDIERHITEAESHYKSPLNYNVFNQNPNDYISEYKQNIRNINSIVRLKEKEYYSWLKDVLHYLRNGVEIDIKNPPSDKLLEDYIFEKDIEIDFIKSEYPSVFKDPEQVFDRCFLILEFLENETEGKSNQANKKRNYTAKHCALSYLFELDLEGKQLPTSDGGLAQTEIDKLGISIYGKTSFTKVVREIAKCDRNNTRELKHISQNWREIVLELSPDSQKLEAYLKQKNIID